MYIYIIVYAPACSSLDTAARIKSHSRSPMSTPLLELRSAPKLASMCVRVHCTLLFDMRSQSSVSLSLSFLLLVLIEGFVELDLHVEREDERHSRVLSGEEVICVRSSSSHLELEGAPQSERSEQPLIHPWRAGGCMCSLHVRRAE